MKNKYKQKFQNINDIWGSENVKKQTGKIEKKSGNIYKKNQKKNAGDLNEENGQDEYLHLLLNLIIK